MSYIQFDKEQLVNLEYSLTRELIRSNETGAYASTTIIGCNTRKYHGLLVAPQPQLDGHRHVLLSMLDETVIQQQSEFNLGIHKYEGGVYSPKGHKYVTELVAEPIPSLTYRVGGVILNKEMLFKSDSDSIIIKYTLLDAHSPTLIRFRPFLAFRRIHSVSKANDNVRHQYEKAPNGIRVCMYDGYQPLNMQFSKEVDYVHNPDWYYNFEYMRERARGYEYLEDLYNPGYFELPVAKGESIYFVASTSEFAPKDLAKIYKAELKNRVPRNSFTNCLLNSAEQFLVQRNGFSYINAGFPWYGKLSRDALVALPGLTLIHGKMALFKTILAELIANMQGPFFAKIDIGMKGVKTYNSVDTPLWFFWTLQQFQRFTGDKSIWKTYGDTMKTILYAFRNGSDFDIKMQSNGLLAAGNTAAALTWMDSYVEGIPVTPRNGLAVEIQALWYNAIMYALELARTAKDTQFIEDWQEIANNLPKEFVDLFWLSGKQYLADYIDGNLVDISVRPNQVIAASLPYVMLSDEQCKGVVDTVRSELLTPRGLRTLSPKDPKYRSSYQGNQTDRDLAFHQGIIFPWLIGQYADAYIRLYEKSAKQYIENLYNQFEEVMTEHGIGSISELYEGDPPYKATGTISQAWSVAEVLRVNWLAQQL